MNKMTIEEIKVGGLYASPTNPRKRFPTAAAKELEGSVRESGVLEPLLVRAAADGRFEIIAGERRWRAARAVGLAAVPCVSREMTDLEVATAQLAENVVRCGLNAMEESAGVDRLGELGLDAPAIAVALGVSRRWVQDRLALGDLPERGRHAVERGAMGLGVAGVILKCAEEERDDVLQNVLELGDDVTDAGAREFVAERYLEPRRRRRVWRELWAELAAKWGDLAQPVEDPEGWAQYVRGWGEGHGRWKAADLALAGVAARPEEAGVTWGELAAAHGLKGLLVPVGGKVDGADLALVCVVDGAAIQAAERAARDAGEDHTIGPRKGPRVEPADVRDAGVDDGEAPADVRRGWHPRVLKDWAWSEEEEQRVQVAVDLLDGAAAGWRALALESAGADLSMEPEALDAADELEALGGWRTLAVWWCLRGSAQDRRLSRLAAMFGVRDVWLEWADEI